MSVTAGKKRRNRNRKVVLPLEERILITELEAAALVGVSQPVVHRWATQGLLRPVALPGGLKRTLYRKQDVFDFVNSL